MSLRNNSGAHSHSAFKTALYHLSTLPAATHLPIPAVRGSHHLPCQACLADSLYRFPTVEFNFIVFRFDNFGDFGNFGDALYEVHCQNSVGFELLCLRFDSAFFLSYDSGARFCSVPFLGDCVVENLL